MLRDTGGNGGGRPNSSRNVLGERLPCPHEHALQEFGILRRRLVGRHGQAAPERRARALGVGRERVCVIVAHVKTRSPSNTAPIRSCKGRSTPHGQGLM